jgi:hypothetical protein
LALATLLVCSGIAPAAPGVLELIPEDAAVALAVRNLNDLKKKGDQFVAATGTRFIARPSQLIEQLINRHGIKGVDADGGIAVMAVNPKIVGIKLWGDDGKFNPDGDWTNLIVIVLPFRDADVIADSFGIAKGKLKPDRMVTGKGKEFGRFFYVRGKHLFYGNHEKAVLSVAKSKPSGGDLMAAQRRMLERADVLAQVNREALDPFWKSMLEDFQRDLEKRVGEKDKKLVRQSIETLRAVRTSRIALRVDEGLGISWVNTFVKEGQAAADARKFLTTLRGGPGVADLAGLPEGRVIAAEAFRGEGAQNAAVLKLFTRLLWEGTRGPRGWLSPTDRPDYVNVFTEIWKRLKGTRVAVYQNTDRLKYGLFSAVAILDTADAGQFLDELRLLARLGGADLDLTGKNERKDDVAAVEKLIGDLGADEYPVRESATTKLALIGEPALPFLDKALKSSDAEVRRRAREIKEGIVAKAEARRKELLDKDALKHVRPTFAFAPKAESLDDVRLDVVQVRIKEKDAAGKLRDLFGPDWDRIRIAVHGRQVVVLLGSDKELLRATLKNLKENKRGLADSKLLAPSVAHLNSARKVEFHLSLTAANALLTAADLKQPAGNPALSSFALTVEPDLLQLDFWLPPSEFKALRNEKTTTPMRN